MTLTTPTLEATVVGHGPARRLRVTAADPSALHTFSGDVTQTSHGHVLDGPLSGANAEAVRLAFPHLRPRPLGRATSAGTGDRLGLATYGHARAFARYGAGVTPVFAQQSIREMDRLERTAQSVLDDATFGCLQAGWTGPVGADTDHIKTTEGIDRGLAAGFTTFTLDPGDHVVDVTGGVAPEMIDAVPWAELEDDPKSMLRRYEGVTVDTGDEQITPEREGVMQAAVKYGAAVADTVRMARHVMAGADRPVEIEVAVDETTWITSFVEHFYMATELQRLGVEWVSFAPRYADGFEKGVEYLGDPEELAANLRGHAVIGEQFGGYKISLHSGSDKFSIYPLVVEATGGRVHLKTSGTSYLCALAVAERHNPDLLREIFAVSLEGYRKARASYQVSAEPDRVPDPMTLADADMGRLLGTFDSRQILHVGYGDVLLARDAQGTRYLDAALRQSLTDHGEDYAEILEEHLGRHLAPFSTTVRARS